MPINKPPTNFITLCENPYRALQWEWASIWMPVIFIRTFGCNLWCTFCVDWDTKIRVEWNSKPISEIKKGDKVITYNEEKQLLEKDEVEGVSKSYVDEIYEMELFDGSKVKITWNHKVFTKDRGWVETKDLKENEEILTW